MIEKRQIGQSHRGGKRNGAGRPLKSEADKATVQVAFRLTPDEAQALGALFADGETLHSCCKRLALEGLDRHEKQEEPTTTPTQSSALQKCLSCGRMFDPWNKRKSCHVCNEPL